MQKTTNRNKREHWLFDKATGIAKSSTKGGFKLFIDVSISSIITALSLILVLRLLGNP